MKKLTFLLVSMLAFNQLSAQTTEDVQLNTITTAVPFVMISGDPQQMASGDVGVVSSNLYNATAFTSNAALLATGHKYLNVNTNFTPWLRALVPDINMVSFSAASAFHKRHAVGFYFKDFSLGNITFTDNQGQSIGSFNPNEFLVQINYATWFPSGISLGIGAKYIYSNLTGGINIGGADTRPGQAFASDLGVNYRKHFQKTDLIGLGYSLGLGLNNIGTKIGYTQTNEKDFLPMNMMVGAMFNLGIKYGKVRFEHDLGYQVTKLLVPTPPEYGRNQYFNDNLPPGDSIGQRNNPSNLDPTFNQIIAGKDPNVPVFQGLIQSFGDAPRGTQEEWNEVIHQVAHEFRFVLNDFFMVAVREGLFYEHETKGNRQFFSYGLGVGVAGFRLDFGGWIPFQSRSPLENTVFVGLSYRMKLGKNKKLMRFPVWSLEQEYANEVEAILDEAD
ncbi:MAG: type IX secretion system outer membrane channel protein PorV [Flavobacteriales bacterium]|nr:type IX secretion system outer membrane channel protein PorV [Flavobacteriales bacterium]